jgi:hypothetical protein
MKQWRVVFKYSRGLVRGAGAAFVIALDEPEARHRFKVDMPDAELQSICVEPEDPRAQYERPALKQTMLCLREFKPAPNGDCWCATCSAVRLVASVIAEARA